MKSINPGDLTELVTIQTPLGESAADDRDATGFVDQHGGTPVDTSPNVWASVRESSFMEIRRAGGEAGQELHTVIINNFTTVTTRSVVLRIEKAETLEVVSVVEPTQHADYLRLICKRAV